MRKALVTFVAVVLALVTLPALAGEVGKEVVWPADKMEFEPVVPGVAKVVLWGDPEKSSYGALTRFDKGLRNPLHTHSHDIKIVVLSGQFVYDSGQGEKALGPGSYLLQPARVQHVSGAGPDGCSFFEESDGPFDLEPVQK